VRVRVGKHLDVMRFRGFDLREHQDEIEFCRRSVERLYADPSRLQPRQECPCCRGAAARAAVVARPYGVDYLRCPDCGHVFVGHLPPLEELSRYFVESDQVSEVYTDPAALRVRLEQVVAPKLEWVCRVYRRHHGREPRGVLDVGAGAGHFLAVCRQRGLEVAGYEINRAALRFARETFGLALRGEDFLSAAPTGERFPLVTFWGLLEYTAEPRRFLQAARSWLEEARGMLVLEVPRFPCLSSLAQLWPSSRPVRHLVPASHLNIFSDASLAEVLYDCGLRPVAAWYFGMDAYELLVQLALRREDPGLLEAAAELIPSLQEALDGALLCDDLILAAVPR
jgi:SAM-dependent methyltransferase